MRRFGLLALVLLAIAAPAQAQVIIEEAPGSQGASMEPTFFLGTETARILPGGLQYVSLAAGSLYTSLLSYTSLYSIFTNLEYNRGMGAGGELDATAIGLLEQHFVPGLALGYKQRVAVLGGWDAALTGKAFYIAEPRVIKAAIAPEYGFLVGAPLTTMVGPGDLTLEPRAHFPDLYNGGGLAVYGLTAGYRVPLGDHWRLLFEAGTGISSGKSATGTAGGGFAPEVKLGVRYMALPTFAVDFDIGMDGSGLGVDPQRPESGDLASLALRFGF